MYICVCVCRYCVSYLGTNANTVSTCRPPRTGSVRVPLKNILRGLTHRCVGAKVIYFKDVYNIGYRDCIFLKIPSPQGRFRQVPRWGGRGKNRLRTHLTFLFHWYVAAYLHTWKMYVVYTLYSNILNHFYLCFYDRLMMKSS